mmetsp:Transcript_3416/g.10366  ORF Transcript_3416/g.10366 Transcript_3416/m.10366 type:complete len:95 (-) Transcript_3416:56-340(-)
MQQFFPEAAKSSALFVRKDTDLKLTLPSVAEEVLCDSPPSTGDFSAFGKQTSIRDMDVEDSARSMVLKFKASATAMTRHQIIRSPRYGPRTSRF